MTIKDEINYRFYHSQDTNSILSSIIKKKAQYERNRDGREKRKDWWYLNKAGFLINPSLIFGKIFPISEEKDDKDKYLNLVLKEFEKFNSDPLRQEILGRYQQTMKKVEENGLKTKNFTSTLSWRMVIGLGASHPQETSMTLHHIYGIPYIPGSAIKGVTRHWVIIKFFEKIGLDDIKQINCLEKILETADLNNPDKNKRDDVLDKQTFKEKFKAKDSKEQRISPDDKLYEFLTQKQSNIILFQNLFGTQDKKGEVIFFDAYPDGKVTLKIDIMNPHYPEYYSEGKPKPPADWQTPTPIKFLTVERTKFQFYLASKDTNLLNQAEKYLKEALKQFGIGAKTSLGYGVFNEI